jgi:hypothetical protein
MPARHPIDDGGAAVPRERCQPIGADLHGAGLRGVWCISAAAREARPAEQAFRPSNHPAPAAVQHTELTTLSHTGVIRMPRHLLAVCAIATLALATAPRLDAQEPWRWDGRLSAGQTIRVSGISGEIRAVPARGAEARVVAVRHARRSDPESVRIVAVESADGVRICAVYPGGRRGDSDDPCVSSGGDMRENDVSVDFEVEVPAGVNFRGSMISGAVEAENLSGDVHGSTISGAVRISTAGHATASTISGPIDVSVRDGARIRDTSFSTISGSITLRVPQNFGADLRASTVSGTIETDLPVTLTRSSRRGLEGTIGNGGPALRLSNISGRIAIRRL